MSSRSLVLGLLVGVLGACGGGPPTRYVVEKDLGDYAYRRYQKVMDVEFPVPENPAVGHTASYVLKDTPDIVVVSVFVSVYQRAPSLSAEVKLRIDSLGSYEHKMREVDGEHVHWLDGGNDAWLVWVSENRVVKVGWPSSAELPEDVAEHYLDIYPSDLDEFGRARKGTKSAGAAEGDEEEEEEDLELPRHLREGAPK